MTSLMMSSCCTLRLNRRRAFSNDSPSCSRTSANLITSQPATDLAPLSLPHLYCAPHGTECQFSVAPKHATLRAGDRAGAYHELVTETSSSWIEPVATLSLRARSTCHATSTRHSAKESVVTVVRIRIRGGFDRVWSLSPRKHSFRFPAESMSPARSPRGVCEPTIRTCGRGLDRCPRTKQ